MQRAGRDGNQMRIVDVAFGTGLESADQFNRHTFVLEPGLRIFSIYNGY